MSHVQIENEDKERLQVGSGDFQQNPIYGDQATRPSYAEFNSDVISIAPENDAPQQPYNQNPQQYNQNPQQFNPNPQQQHMQNPNTYTQRPPQYTHAQSVPQTSYQAAQSPPQYPQNPQSQSYGGAKSAYLPNQYANDEAVDVVAQMNSAYKEDVPEEELDYGASSKGSHDAGFDSNHRNGYGLFGNFLLRTSYMSISIFMCSLFSFSMWFQKIVTNEFKTAFGLSGFAALMLFIASILSFIWVLFTKLGRPIPLEKILLWGIIALYIIGGLFYFIGGCAVAYAWNRAKMSSIAGIFFIEQTFVAIHAILAAIDLWKREILNDKQKRVLIYNGVFLLLCVVDFFSYAVTSSEWDAIHADNAGAAWLALFYFIIFIPNVLYVLIFLIDKLNESFGKPVVFLLLGVIYLICAFCLLIGYFILVGTFQGVKGRAYFLGIGLFVTLCAIVNAFDIVFDRFIPGYKDGGESVADQGINGAAVIATHDPDAPIIDNNY